MRALRIAAVIVWLPLAAQTVPYPGTSVAGELSASESRTFSIAMRAGQFAIARAEQLSGDVTLVWSDGARRVSVDRSASGGSERILWIADSAGEHTVTVATTVPGRAQFRLGIELRAPSTTDQAAADAFRLIFVDAEDLAKKQTAGASRQQLQVLETAAARASAAGDQVLEGHAHMRRGRVLNALGDKKGSQAAYQRALDLFAPLPGERYGWVSALIDLGTSKAVAGELTAGVELLERGLAISRAEKYPTRELTALNGLALAASARGDFLTALSFHEQILPLLAPLGMESDLPIALNNIATSSANSGNMQRAIETFGQALELRKRAGDHRGTARTLNNLGQTLISINEIEKGESYLRQAMELFRTAGDRIGEAGAHTAFGESRLRAGRAADAAAEFEAAVALYRQSGMNANLGGVLGPLAEMYSQTGAWGKARATAEEALALHRNAGVGVSLSRAYTALALVAEQDGRHGEVLRQFDFALEAARKSSERDGEGRILATRSAYYRRQQNASMALADIERSMAISDLAATRIANAATRTAYRASRANRASDHIDLLMTMHAREPAAGYADRAYVVAERSRARSLGEFLSASVKPRPISARESELVAKLTTVQNSLFRDGVPPVRRKALEKELAEVERDLDLLQRSAVQLADESLYEVWDGERTRRELAGADGAVLTYALGPERSTAWVHTAEGTQVVVLPGRAEIEKEVEAFRQLLSRPVNALTSVRDQAAVAAAGRRLHRMLVAPAMPRLVAKQSLLIIPDGALAYLPFEALGEGRALIESHRIAYAPSASIAGALGRPSAAPANLLLAMGDPLLPSAAAPGMAAQLERGFTFSALPNARGEVESLGRLFPNSRTFVGEKASESRIKAEDLVTYRYLHLAAHGYFDGSTPERSGIVLAPGGAEDGFLQAREIANLRMTAELVTLSACQSGLGKVLAGEGVQGLARAFFLAGAKSVVVSLWDVNDAATAELMRRFYANLKSGLSKDEALRQAKLAIRNQPGGRWRHPYYWAPFVLQGAPGTR